MEQRPGKWKRFKEKWKDHYRLVILSDETFHEVGSYRLSLGNMYVLLSSVIVVIGFFVVALIVFTPLKRLIPGYGDIEDNRLFIQLYEELDDIERSVDAQEVYLSHFRKLITADEVTDSTGIPDDKIAEIMVDPGLFSNPSSKQKPLNRTKNLSSLGLDASPSLKQSFFVPPVTGPVSAGYLEENRHFGVDVLAPKNTPIKSIMDGNVIISGWDLETGYTIGIQHVNNLVTFYKHNSVLLKQEGDFVKAGEAVAIIGNSGTLSDGPHLHFELWFNGTPVNPEDFINFN
jgi:hypothetical protein